MLKRLNKPLLIGFIFSLLLNGYFLIELQQAGEGLKVVEVFDGDTFAVEPNQSVRLADVDAPGLSFCLGQEAKKRLEEIVSGKRVVLQETSKDVFKRTLAYVYVDSVFVNQIMLEEGLGRYDCVKCKPELKEASHRAQDANLGVYGQCTQAEPPDPKCAIKGNIDKHYSEKIYHFPGCSGYNVVIVEKDRGEDWFCSEKEAEAAGFTKSKNCPTKPYQP